MQPDDIRGALHSSDLNPSSRDPFAPPLPGAPPPLLLTGPTAVGKSEVAMLLAERWSGEIVSVDSMQVYRGLDIGTAKPRAAERARVPHHLLDVVDVAESFDAARFVALAGEAVRGIQARGRLAILCGGTGLYFKAFLEGLGTAPPSDPAVRTAIEQTPMAELLRELAERDPVTFARIDRRNPRRVMRAVEVIRMTGRPFSEQRSAWGKGSERGEKTGAEPAPPLVGPFLFAFNRPAAALRRRIDVRVHEMFARGLVAETAWLLERGLAGNRGALQALGYRQVAEHLRGARTLEETIRVVQQRTWQFAKRQLTWLRHQLPVTWLEWGEGETAEAVALRVWRMFRPKS